MLQWPANDLLYLKQPLPTAQTRVTLLGYHNKALEWTPLKDSNGIMINLAKLNTRKIPYEWAYTFKLEYAE